MKPWEAEQQPCCPCLPVNPVTLPRPGLPSSAWPHRLYHRQALVFAFLLGGDPRRASSSCRHPLLGALLRLSMPPSIHRQQRAALLLGSNAHVSKILSVGRSCTNEALRIKLPQKGRVLVLTRLQGRAIDPDARGPWSLRVSFCVRLTCYSYQSYGRGMKPPRTTGRGLSSHLGAGQVRVRSTHRHGTRSYRAAGRQAGRQAATPHIQPLHSTAESRVCV